MTKFIQNGTIRVSVGEITAYWETHDTGTESGLLVTVLKSGDRIAWVQSKEDTKRMAEYLDRQNQIMNFKCVGNWQHVGSLTQDLLELRNSVNNSEETTGGDDEKETQNDIPD